MTFAEDFPSLKDIHHYVDKAGDGRIWRCKVMLHCIDKKRLKKAVDKMASLTNCDSCERSMSFLKEELGL